MGKFKIGINFDKKFLNALKDDVKSGVTVQKCVRHLSLHPIHLHNVFTSIKNLLNDEITKYNKSYGGILLGYQNIKLPTNIGLINTDSCYIHTNIEADFFIFKPEVGKELQGIVNRKSKDHVGVLVYNAFNVSIPKPEDDDEIEEWLGSSVSVGSEVLFRITDIDLSSCLPHIKGELISVISEFDSKISIGDEIEITSKAPLNKRIIFDDDVNEVPVMEKVKKKRKSNNMTPENTGNSKKRKIIDNNINENDDSEINQSEKKKSKHKQKDVIEVSKKKKKKHNEEENESLSLSQNIKTELETSDQSINIHNSEKKKKSKRKKDILNGYKDVSVKDEISIEEFNLTELFNESKFDKTRIKQEMLDNELDRTISEVKKTKKRRQSISEIETSVKKHKRNSS